VKANWLKVIGKVQSSLIIRKSTEEMSWGNIGEEKGKCRRNVIRV